jgi:hypothetical protein
VGDGSFFLPVGFYKDAIEMLLSALVGADNNSDNFSLYYASQKPKLEVIFLPVAINSSFGFKNPFGSF